jgi:N-acetylglucosamine kinase-like BadF-type ATPase
VSGRIVLAVDGGNSKTDVALVREDGEVLAAVRGAVSSPHHIGLQACVAALQELYESALALAGLDGARDGPIADVGQLLLAGLDFPAEEEQLRAAVAPRAWARRLIVGNDTFAVLRTGTERHWGVAVVCGAGINCVGVAPDGRHARFPALGAITGDWGGGYDLGLAALSAAARGQDGRGPRTRLESSVPAHFGLDSPAALGEAIHRGRIPLRRVVELAPVVFAEAGDDAVAAALVQRLVDEIVTFARVALARLGLTHEPAEVVLGGGLLQHADGPLLEAIRAGLREVGPELVVRPTAAPAVAGAALLGLDELGTGPEAQARARAQLAHAVVTTRGEPLAAVTNERPIDG